MKRVESPGQKIDTITSATQEMVDRFTRTHRRRHGPSIDDFRLDLDSKGLASAWNKHAAVIFSDYFLSLGKYTCSDKGLIRKAFMTHLIQLKMQYKKFVNGQAQDAEDYERDMRNARLARRRNVCRIRSITR